VQCCFVLSENILQKCSYRILPAGVQPVLTHTLRPFYSRPIVLTQEGRSLVNDVCECVSDWRVRQGWVGTSSLSGIYSAPLLGMAYCLALLTPVIHRQSTDPAKSITSANVSTTDTLTLLIKVPAILTFHRGHRRTRCCLPGIIFPDHHAHRNYFHIITFT